MTTNQTTPGPWTFDVDYGGGDIYIETRGGTLVTVVPTVDGRATAEANAAFIVAACNACMAVSPDSPITVAECIPELVKLARLVTTRPEWQQAVDDLGLSNQIHKLLTCIERRHK